MASLQRNETMNERASSIVEGDVVSLLSPDSLTVDSSSPSQPEVSTTQSGFEEPQPDHHSESTIIHSDAQSRETAAEAVNEESPGIDFRTPSERRLQHSVQPDSQPLRRLWNPFWLRKHILLSFAAVFASSALALILLWVFSEHDRGFPLLTTNHYIWTYAPTAVLTIVASLWSQTQFWCLSLAPWRRLRNESASASHSLVLDYISPILPTTLFKAIKLREIAVVLSIVCTILLKLVVVASTGLLVPVTTQLQNEDYELKTKTTFNTLRQKLSNADTQAESQIMYETYAALSLGLPYPDGIKGDVAYQTFEAPTSINATNAIVSAVVDAFYPLFRCETAQIVPLSTSKSSIGEHEQVNTSVSFAWSSCPQTMLKPLPTWFPISDPAYNPAPQRQLYGQLSIEPIECSAEPGTFWQLFTIFDVRFNQSSAAGAALRNYTYGEPAMWGVQIMPLTGMICSIDYAFEKAKVSYDYTGDIPNVIVDGPIATTGRRIPGLNTTNFIRKYLLDSNQPSMMLGNWVTGALDENYPDTFFGTMSKVANASYVDFLHNQTLMVEAATTVSNSSLIHFTSYYTIVNESMSIQGQISVSSTRLRVPQLALWLMVAGLACMSVLTLLLLRYRPVDVVPCNTASIGGVTLIVARSLRLRDLLRDTGRMRLSSIRHILSSYMFQSHGFRPLLDQSFSIDPITLREHVQTDFWRDTWQRASKRSIEWWSPLPLRPLVFGMISLLPLALIATLEVLQRLSSRDHGITTVPGSGNIKTLIGTRFVPSLTMVTVAILYDSICFNVSLYAPYQKLKKGNATMQHSLMSVMLGKISPHALYVSLRHKHWAAAFANMAGIVGSVLTIAASGLYTVGSTPGATDIMLQRNDFFNLSWVDSVKDDGGAAVVLTELEFLNLSYPRWTYDGLALPGVRVSNTSVEQVNRTQNEESVLTVRLPALRAALNCTIASENEYSVEMTTERRDSQAGKLYINASTPLPPECRLGDRTDSNPSLEWFLTFQVLTDSSFIGVVRDLHVRSSNDDFRSVGEANSTLQADNPPGCPSLAVAFGNFSQSNGFFDTAPSNFTVMTCYQLMTEVETDVKITLPNWTITSAAPDERTVKYLESGTNGENAFQYRPQAHMELEMIAFNQSNADNTGFPSSPNVLQLAIDYTFTVDSFFALMLFGKHSTDPAGLWGPDNHERLISATEILYRRYMAQVATRKMRSSVPVRISSDHPADELYSATWLDPDRNDLRQNNASKIVLQAILGLMFLCGVISFWLLDSHETLTHNPCSIAGIASLVADSQICSELFAASLPRNAEWMTASDLRENGVWRGWTFRMGWWEGDENQQRRFGIDRVGAE